MSNNRHIVFLTGTRADYGKIKSLIISSHNNGFRVSVFATGMHLLPQFGNTLMEIQKTLPKAIEIISFKNQPVNRTMDMIVAKTITGLSSFISKSKPDAIIIHGDRPEALAGAIAGALRNIRVVHIEGGELSGTIDGIMRHAVSKLSHVHLVANNEARLRLLQLGETESNIHIIGSPDLDIMNSQGLPSLRKAQIRYGINFDDYLIGILHPVTTDIKESKKMTIEYVSALIESRHNFIIIHPNNDPGYKYILKEFERLRSLPNRFRIFESLRFEYFLTFLKHAQALVGNSSAGIREAPFYSVPSVDIGTRQRGRYEGPTVISCPPEQQAIISAMTRALVAPKVSQNNSFGDGHSSERFIEVLRLGSLFSAPLDKIFIDLKGVT